MTESKSISIDHPGEDGNKNTLTVTRLGNGDLGIGVFNGKRGEQASMRIYSAFGGGSDDHLYDAVNNLFEAILKDNESAHAPN